MAAYKLSRPWLLVRVGVSLVAVLISLEVALRLFLFSDVTVLRSLGEPLRRPGLYCAGPKHQDYWTLVALFDPDTSAPIHGMYDPLLGWRKKALHPLTYVHREAGRLGERRPVLFYGDSYAACTTGREWCWESQLERSELCDEFLLLNYGVGGYGVDQVYLLIEASVDLYADRQPVVVVGILLDDDLDRTAMDLRAAPKPRSRLVDGHLDVAEVPAVSGLEYAKSHPLAPTSYLVRYITYGIGLLPGDTVDLESRASLNRRVIEEICRSLEARRVPFFFVLFHGDELASVGGGCSWQETLVRATLHELGVPYVSSLEALTAHAKDSGKNLADYFVHEGRRIKHYPPETNRVVFPAILKQLRTYAK